MGVEFFLHPFESGSFHSQGQFYLNFPKSDTLTNVLSCSIQLFGILHPERRSEFVKTQLAEIGIYICEARRCVVKRLVKKYTMRLTATTLTLILLTSISEQLFACSCIGQRTVKEEFNHANAVIVGTIIRKELVVLTDSSTLNQFPNDTPSRNVWMNTITIARYDLLVYDVYKGKITSDTLTIFTGLGGGDCGIRFEIGTKYIVYGENKTYLGLLNKEFKFPQAKNAFWTYNCLRTNSWFQEEITEIEKFARKRRRKTGSK